MRVVLGIDQTFEEDEWKTSNDQEGSEEAGSETRTDRAARGQALHPARRCGPHQGKR
jgi:hypothetical protein